MWCLILKKERCLKKILRERSKSHKEFQHVLLSISLMLTHDPAYSASDRLNLLLAFSMLDSDCEL